MRISPLFNEGSQAVVPAFEGPLINGIENRTAILDDEGKPTRVLGFKVLARSAVNRRAAGEKDDSLIRGGACSGEETGRR